VLRIYTSTISWNLKKRRFFTAISRVLHGGLVLLLSMRYIFSSEYWEGVRTHHARNHLHYVVEEEERRVQQGRPATKD
jgi:transposase-like protein